MSRVAYSEVDDSQLDSINPTKLSKWCHLSPFNLKLSWGASLIEADDCQLVEQYIIHPGAAFTNLD